MNGYLLDTDIVVFFLRNRREITEHLSSLNPQDVYISEVTIAELEYGCRCSGKYEENARLLKKFISFVNVIPFSEAIDYYAQERYRLRKLGIGIEDFDLLIGCTSVSKNLIMVTNNVRHYSRIEGIQIERWI